MKSKSIIPLAVTATLIFVAGCGRSGPAVVPVTGVVKVNGQPMADVFVEFQPNKEGWGSRGKTGADGKFELFYRDGEKGAEAVKHKVKISTLVEQDDESKDPIKKKGRPEMLPPQYNEKSTLEADLSGGDGTELTFDLEVHPKLVSMMEKYQKEVETP